MEHKIITNTNKQVKQSKVVKLKEKKGNNSSEHIVNFQFLDAEMQWLKKIIEKRCTELLLDTVCESILETFPLPKTNGKSPYETIINDYDLREIDRMLLALGVASSQYPLILKPFIDIEEQNASLAIYTGGEYHKATRTFKPSFQTALFLLVGKDLSLWTIYSAQLIQGSSLLQNDIIYNRSSENTIHGKIELDEGYLTYFLKGEKPRLDHGAHFPGVLYTTKLTIDDIILAESIHDQVKSIGYYISALENDFFNTKTHKFKAGFMVLFHGPPGTGKTLLAGILANTYGIDMYHINLSKVVSKYIGETEKNLEIVFNRLQGKNCMLFFDEADAIFGKRSDVKDAHDRYANQEVSYLLQRIEKFDGLVILASNFENNMDDAFKRRIDISINITRPKAEEREALWIHYLPENLHFESDELLKHLSDKYAYTGANIRNIMKHVAIELRETGKVSITYACITKYLKSESEKAFGVNQARIFPLETRQRK